jgi:integrase
VAEKLRKLSGQAQQTGRLPTTNLNVERYLTTWLEQSKNRLRPTTVADYSVMLRLHVVPHIGHVKLTRLSALQLGSYYVTLSETLSPRRLRMVHDLLHKALGDAVKYGLMASNVAGLVEAPKRKDKPPKLWRPEQVNIFLNAMLEDEGGQYGNLFVFLLASGCRIGEALALRLGDVELAEGTVHIDKQLIQLGNRLLEDMPKTANGVRNITLPGFGVEALRKQLALSEAQKADDRLFTSEVGTVPERNNVRRSFVAICRNLGLPAIRIHDLRHLNLSLLAMNGVPVKVAQQRAGHSSAVVTLKVYQHVLGDADRQAAEMLDRIRSS